nr:prepilin-type N-terminal cleavage/methylation domain-containing protein [uncultured Desulfuromonas sp.]
MSSIAKKLHTLLQKQRKMRQRRKNGESGFTLLEILVVLTIMGFLIAMVAPRLAGISGGAVDTVCDSNQSRMIQMTAAYIEKAGRLPNKLTNLVVEDGSTAGSNYAIPSVEDEDPDNGQETLALEFSDRVAPVIHYLTEDEADELKDLGIKRVFNLNSYDNSPVSETNQGAPMREIAVAANVGVMMSGVGAAGNDADFAAATDDIIGYGEADFLGRIVFGFGPENSVITSGLVSNAAHCPGGIQNADNITYNDYNLIVPRLSATVDRNADGTTHIFGDAATTPNGYQFVAYGYTEDFSTTGSVGSTVDGATGEHTAIDDGLKARTVSFKGQELWQYATMCPEGHMFPADDSDFWAIDLDGTSGVTINAAPQPQP